MKKIGDFFALTWLIFAGLVTYVHAPSPDFWKGCIYVCVHRKSIFTTLLLAIPMQYLQKSVME